MVFQALIFTKLTNDLPYNVLVCLTKYYPNPIMNMEDTDRNSFLRLSKVWLSLY